MNDKAEAVMPPPLPINYQKSNLTEAETVLPLIERARTMPFAGIESSSDSVKPLVLNRLFAFNETCTFSIGRMLRNVLTCVKAGSFNRLLSWAKLSPVPTTFAPTVKMSALYCGVN